MSETPNTSTVLARPEDVLVYQGEGNIVIKSMELLRKLYGTFPKERYAASDEEMLQFAHLIQHYGLDPSIKDVIMVARRQNVGTRERPDWRVVASSVIGYPVPKAKALAAQLVAEPEEIEIFRNDRGVITEAEIRVWRKGMTKPFVLRLPIGEIIPQKASYFWSSEQGGMPTHMIRKTLTFRGYRDAFSDLFRGWQSEAEIRLEDTALNHDEPKPDTAIITTRRDPSAVEHRPEAKVKVKQADNEPETKPAEPAVSAEVPTPKADTKPDTKPANQPRRRTKESPPLFGGKAVEL